MDLVIQNLLKNIDTAKKIVKEVLPKLSGHRGCMCATALKDAIVTNPKMMPAKTKKKLGLIIGKYVK
jgi:5'-methylthioadenosine phosphorylase